MTSISDFSLVRSFSSLSQMLFSLRDVKTIYILIRPKKKVAPQARANKEIAGSPIFSRLRYELGDDFDAYFQVCVRQR